MIWIGSTPCSSNNASTKTSTWYTPPHSPQSGLVYSIILRDVCNRLREKELLHDYSYIFKRIFIGYKSYVHLTLFYIFEFLQELQTEAEVVRMKEDNRVANEQNALINELNQHQKNMEKKRKEVKKRSAQR